MYFRCRKTPPWTACGCRMTGVWSRARSRRSRKRAGLMSVPGPVARVPACWTSNGPTSSPPPLRTSRRTRPSRSRSSTSSGCSGGPVSFRCDFPWWSDQGISPVRHCLASAMSFRPAGWARDTDQVQDASQITPPVVLRTEERFNTVSIEVDLNAGLKLAGITSPYHPIDVRESAPGRYSVVLAEGNVPADRDFVLRWRPLLTDQPTAALFSEVWKGKHYGLLMVMPPQPQSLPEPVARELVLVVDTSGSMHGDSIAQAREALLSALQQLKPGDRFNIIQFNSGLDALFDEAMLAAPGTSGTGAALRARPAGRRRYRDAARDAAGPGRSPPERAAAPGSVSDRWCGRQRTGAVRGRGPGCRGTAACLPSGSGLRPMRCSCKGPRNSGAGPSPISAAPGRYRQKVASLFRQISAPVLTDVRLNWQMAGGGRAGRPGTAGRPRPVCR